MDQDPKSPFDGFDPVKRFENFKNLRKASRDFVNKENEKEITLSIVEFPTEAGMIAICYWRGSMGPRFMMSSLRSSDMRDGNYRF